MVWDEMSFEEFQDGLHACHLGYQNGTILVILNLCVTVMPPIKFQLNQTYGLKEMLFEEFQNGHHGGHLGHQNRTILAILNFHVATIPPTKFQLNSTNSSGGDVETVNSS